MSVEENIVLMRRWFKEVWNEGRVQTIYDLMDENAIATGQDQPGVVLHGPADFVALFNRIRGAFPDIRITLEDAFGADDKSSPLVRRHDSHRRPPRRPRHQQEGPHHRHHYRAHRKRQSHRRLGRLGPARLDAAALNRREHSRSQPLDPLTVTNRSNQRLPVAPAWPEPSRGASCRRLLGDSGG